MPQYLLTVTTDEGDSILSHSVEGLTENQLAGIFASFTERDKDDDSGPAAADDSLETDWALERLHNAAESIAQDLLGSVKELGAWDASTAYAFLDLSKIAEHLLKGPLAELAGLQASHAHYMRGGR